MGPLETLIRERIASAGPMRLDEYMALCLGHPEHGYYATRDPLGAAGDFVTAPEISQMFGELVGAWLAETWVGQGRPTPFVLAELGPGRGTLMRDALRVAGRIEGFAEAAELWLLETSPVLCRVQATVLAGAAPRWVEGVAQLPPGPLFAVANEFFDALPIRQFQHVDALWRERRVGLTAGEHALVWGAPRPDRQLDARFPEAADGAVVEVSPGAEAIASVLGARVAAAGGAALFIDYGSWDGTGDTLQAVAGHRRVDPLEAPGRADLTAHVRFRALAEAGRPARMHGPVAQGVFLERLGITARARALAAGRGAEVAAAHRRLTHPAEMGNLFQVLALVPEGAPVPPGFNP